MVFNWLDITIFVFVGVFSALGFAKGVVRQFFGILAFVLASALSFILPIFVKIPSVGGMSQLSSHALFSVLVWTPAFLILNSVGKYIAKKMTAKGITFWDRLWGMLFGCVKGFIIIALIVFLLEALPDGIKKYAPGFSDATEDSVCFSSIRPYNPLAKLRVIKNLNILISTMDDPYQVNLLKNDAQFQKLRRQESIKAVLEDPELKKAVQNRQYLDFFTNPKIRALISDREALDLLLKTDIDTAVIANL